MSDEAQSADVMAAVDKYREAINASYGPTPMNQPSVYVAINDARARVERALRIAIAKANIEVLTRCMETEDRQSRIDVLVDRGRNVQNRLTEAEAELAELTRLGE